MSASTAASLASKPDHVPAELVVNWDCLKPTQPHEDIYLAWKTLHKGPDIIWTPRYGGHWVATRGEDIDFMQKNYDPFSMRDIAIPPDPARQPRALPLEADPPEHAPYRAIVTPWFTPKNIEALMVFTRQLAADLVDKMYAKGECEFYSEFALDLPIAIFCKLTNMPWSEREKLLALAEQSVRGAPDQRVIAWQSMAGLIAQVLQERRANPGTDILSDVVRAKINGEPIGIPEAISMAMTVFLGGLDTVAATMSHMAYFLATHPEHRKQIAENPAIIPQAVDEMLRRFGVAQTARMLSRDFEYKGVHFKEGEQVMVPTFMYGLDDRKFDNPMEVDFNRKSTIHAGFGAGPHRCPGSFLARTELKLFLEEWFKRIPDFDIKPGAQAVFAPGSVQCMHSVPLSWTVK